MNNPMFVQHSIALTLTFNLTLMIWSQGMAIIVTDTAAVRHLRTGVKVDDPFTTVQWGGQRTRAMDNHLLEDFVRTVGKRTYI